MADRAGDRSEPGCRGRIANNLAGRCGDGVADREGGSVLNVILLLKGGGLIGGAHPLTQVEGRSGPISAKSRFPPGTGWRPGQKEWFEIS